MSVILALEMKVIAGSEVRLSLPVESLSQLPEYLLQTNYPSVETSRSPFLSALGPENQTETVRLGSKHVSPLSHPAALLSYFMINLVTVVSLVPLDPVKVSTVT